MTLDIKSTSSLTHYYGRFMFYGDARTWKTRCAATFPKPLFLACDTEGGVLSIRDTATDYHSVNEPNDALEALDDLHAMADRGKLKHRTVVFDSLTMMQENQIDNLLGLRRREKGLTRDKKLNLTDADWGTITSTLRSLLIEAHALPMHVIWICLCDREYGKPMADREVEMLSGHPMIYTRRAAKKMGGVCDFLWYFESVYRKNKGNTYRIHTETYDRHIAGSRTDTPATLKPNFKSFSKHLGLKTMPKKKKKG